MAKWMTQDSKDWSPATMKDFIWVQNGRYSQFTAEYSMLAAGIVDPLKVKQFLRAYKAMQK